MNTNWEELITKEMARHDDSWANIESTTLTPEQQTRQFYSGFGGEEGDPFTVWTADRVYFPACYDGSEWCASVPRHPNGQPTSHIGG